MKLPVPRYLRAQVSTAADTLLPRDYMSVNPCFLADDSNADFDAFALAVANVFDTFTSGSGEVNVKIYDIKGPKPNFPLAVRKVRPGVAVVSDAPRELALCLSYYAGQNRPKYRGRLYIPLVWLASRAAGIRPSTVQMDAVLALGDLLSAVGGAGFTWGVWSTVDQGFRTATNVWVDDEWDIIRSRGLRGTARSLDTVTG